MTIEETFSHVPVKVDFRKYYYTYPSGEIGIKHKELFTLLSQDDFFPTFSLSSSLDYYAFSMLQDLFNKLNLVRKNKLSIYLPYFPYSREDKLAQIDYYGYKVPIFSTLYEFCTKLDNFGLHSIRTLDLHSDVPIQYFRNTRFYSLEVEQWIIEKTIDKILNKRINNAKLLLVFPDKGAMQRYQYVFPIISNYLYNVDLGKLVDVYYFSKVREQSTGKILSIELESGSNTLSPDITDILVFDDICDGGTTFLECGKILKKHYPLVNMHLYTTHGMYTNDSKYQELCNMYKNVICTDSFSGIRPDRSKNHHVIAL